MRPVIAVLDYGMGNRRSVEKALERVGAEVHLTGDPVAVRAAQGLVVPGVGAFPAGMRRLREGGLDEVVREHAASGRPLLGICLGMQLLFDSSTELEPCAGLGLMPGTVRPLDAGGGRVPHIGWNRVTLPRPSPLTATLPPAGAAFYHVHSYVARPERAEDVVGVAEYGESFASIVACANIFGVQFHPEKSSRDGLALLAAFAGLCAGTAGAAGSEAQLEPLVGR